MKIRTQFFLSLIAFSIVLVVVGASFFFTSNELESANQQDLLAHNIAQGATELGYLANDYLLHGEPQQRARWESQFAQVAADLEMVQTSDRAVAAIIANIRSNQHSLETVFADVAATIERGVLNEPGTRLAFVQVAWSRLQVPTQAMVFDTSRLPQFFQDRASTVQQRQVFLAVILLILVIGYFITNYFLIYRRTLKGIADIQAGAGLIGSGNLDYTIPAAYDDEVGGLARAFNRMAANLKIVTASKTDLEREIARRSQVEEELLITNEQLQESACKLEAEMEERKAAEKEIETLSRFPLENPNPVLRVSPQGVLLFANPASAQILRCWNLAAGGTLPANIRATITEISESGAPKLVEVDCEECIYDFVFAPIAEADYINLYARDITERKRAEKALRESEENYRRIITTANEGIWVARPDGTTILVNRRMADMLGYPLDELKRRIGAEFLDKEWAAAVSSTRAELAEGASIERELKFIRRDGTPLWTLVSVAPLTDNQGRHYANLSMHSDITDRKQAEANLQVSERKYRELFRSMIEGFALHELIVDYSGKPVDYRFIEVNPAFETMTGLKAESIVGKSVKEVIPGIEPLWIETYGKVVISGTPITFENYSAALGRWYQVQAYSPAPGRFATIFSDVTERKKSETLKDEFIGMISHELKTPLTVVIGALSTAAMEGLPENLRRDLFHDAVSHSEMLASIVDNLLELSRSQSARLDLHKVPADVRLIACKVVGQLKTKSAIHNVICEFPETLPLVPADPLRLERILYNLVENAIKYSPAGGEVKTFARQNDGFLVIGVSDQGIGISAENQPKLFQSFERLGAEVKGAIQGTGLGLRVCRILAEAHGGKIWVESTPGRGSTFYFTLPLTNTGK